MNKGAETRQRIVEAAAELFNERGYGAASVSDVMDATGLQKGGIYRHFESKESLSLEAFDYAIRRVGARIRERVDESLPPIERVLALVDVFTEFAKEPAIPGGCPIMNAAMESAESDQMEELRERSRAAMGRLLSRVRSSVEDGIARGEINPEVDPDAIATMVIAGIEGALMISRLYHDPAYSVKAGEQLKVHINRELRIRPA